MRYLLALALLTTTAAAQDGLPARLQKAFLGAGLNYDVYIDKGALTVWGCMNNSTVYQVLTATGLLKATKEAGYNRLDFKNGRCGGDLWTFDLSGPVPACDTRKRVCL